MRRVAVAAAVSLGLGLAEVARPGPTYVESPVPDGGVLAGRVRFAGPPPAGEPLAVRKNTDVCGEHKPSQALVVGPTKGVTGTVVALEGVERGKRAADFELDNAKCLFIPHVSAVMAGAKVRIKNSDPVLYNTMASSSASPCSTSRSRTRTR